MPRRMHDAFLAEVMLQNGWAPLLLIAVQGLSNDGRDQLVREIAEHWLSTFSAIFARKAWLIEMNALEPVEQASTHPGGGGDSPLQYGFDWSNSGTEALFAQQFVAKAAP